MTTQHLVPDECSVHQRRGNNVQRSTAYRIAPSHMALAAGLVASLAGISVADLVGRSRRRAHAWPRQKLFHLLHAEGYAFAVIGRTLGFDHTTVMHGCEAHEKRTLAAA